jgi:hypothetical protein
MMQMSTEEQATMRHIVSHVFGQNDLDEAEAELNQILIEKVDEDENLVEGIFIFR